MSTRIPLQSIVVDAGSSAKTVHTWDDAHTLIRLYVTGCRCTITWADGFQVVVSSPSSPLADEVRNRWILYAGLGEHAEQMAKHPDRMHQATEALKRYALADLPKPDPATDLPTLDEINQALLTVAGLAMRAESLGARNLFMELRKAGTSLVRAKELVQSKSSPGTRT